MDDLLAARVGELLERVAESDPEPGSGAIAGIALALAAALVAGAARASTESWSEARAAAAQAEALRGRAERLAVENAAAYREARRTLDARSEGGRALADALERAAAVPLAIGETGCDVALLAGVVARLGEQDRRADVLAAAFLADAATRAAAGLVAVNLTATPGDERVTRAQALAAAARTAATGAADGYENA